MDFGDVPVGSQRTQAITIVNPAAFDVTVVGIVLEGEGFTTEKRAARVALPERDQFVLTIRFRPLTRGRIPGACCLKSTRLARGLRACRLKVTARRDDSCSTCVCWRRTCRTTRMGCGRYRGAATPQTLA
jgi:hypothetical protein